jgi:hypothetical protein
MNGACRARWGVALAAVFATGCYSSATDGADGRDGTGDGACSTPARWVLAETEILRFEPVDPPPNEVGRVVRLYALISTTGAECSEYAGYDVSVDPTTAMARVTVSVWRKVDALAGPCAPTMEPTRVVVKLTSLTAGTWTVMDGSVGATGDPVTTTVEVAPCDGTCSCSGVPADRGEGQDCTLDCQCRDDLLCVGYLGLGGDLLRTCEPSCSDDRDCRAALQCMDFDDGPSRTCRRMPFICRWDCPAGLACRCGATGCYCEVAAAVESVPCCRNEDCPEGNVCIGASDPGVLGMCRVPCRHDFNCTGELPRCQVPPDMPSTCSHWSE